MVSTSEAKARPGNGSAQPPAEGRHLYSAGDVNRINVIHVLGTITAAGATGIVLLTHVSDWIGVVIAAALLWLTLAGFEKRAWRWRLTAKVPHCAMPDLSGEWSGRIEINKGKEGEDIGMPLDCHVEIKQDWSRIAINLQTEVSRSWSVMASIDARRAANDVVDHELHHEYYVTPRCDAPPELSTQVELVDPHYGTAHLKLGPGSWPRVRPTSLSGIWFNDQNFKRWGTITLTRIPRPRRLRWLTRRPVPTANTT